MSDRDLRFVCGLCGARFENAGLRGLHILESCVSLPAIEWRRERNTALDEWDGYPDEDEYRSDELSVDIDDLIKRLFWAGPEGVAVTQDEARELYLLAFASYDDDLRDDRDELNQQSPADGHVAAVVDKPH